MTKSLLPQVLIVDDQPDEVLPRRLELQGRAIVAVVAPDDVTEVLLGRSHLVMVDYRLEYWPSRERQSTAALRPENGIALAAVLRSYFSRHPRKPLPAFALYSGKLAELGGASGPVAREHTIARFHNLEWVFPKQELDGDVHLSKQIIGLASAVRALPRTWPADNRRVSRLLRSLLRLPDSQTWCDRAWDDVERCYPPRRDLADASRGLSVIRWLLQRILPYPCFLLDVRHLAARLRVTVPSLRLALTGNRQLLRRLRGSAYDGVLKDFLGPRWWRAGIDSMLWTATRGHPFDATALRTVISGSSGTDLEPLGIHEPVVALGDDLRPTEELADIADCVQLHVDDWPSYAEPPLIRAEDAVGPMEALVISRDRDRMAKKAKTGSDAT